MSDEKKNPYSTWILTDEEIMAGDPNCDHSRQILLLLQAKGAPVLGNIFLRLDPQYWVEEYRDNRARCWKYHFINKSFAMQRVEK